MTSVLLHVTCHPTVWAFARFFVESTNSFGEYVSLTYKSEVWSYIWNLRCSAVKKGEDSLLGTRNSFHEKQSFRTSKMKSLPQKIGFMENKNQKLREKNPNWHYIRKAKFSFSDYCLWIQSRTENQTKQRAITNQKNFSLSTTHNKKGKMVINTFYKE